MGSQYVSGSPGSLRQGPGSIPGQSTVICGGQSGTGIGILLGILVFLSLSFHQC